MEKEVYVTFTIPHLYSVDEKIAVRCDNDDEAREVASDAYSLNGIRSIRLRHCGKPSNRLIISFSTYWDYSKWYK